MSLREEIRRLAVEAAGSASETEILRIESAILEGVKLVLERHVGFLDEHAGKYRDVEDSWTAALRVAVYEELAYTVREQLKDLE